MRLTVCTAVWNAVRSVGLEALERCLRSVAVIPCAHEHLVYDGGSEDGTVELLARLAAEIPTLRFVSERDGGIYEALNKGVRDAKGDWFYVLGADDLVSQPETLVRHLDAADAEAAQVSISPVETDDGWRPLFRAKIYGLSSGMVYPHQGALIRTELVRRLGGYDPRYRVVGDYKLHLTAHLAGARTRVAWEPFAHYALAGVSADIGRLRTESAQAAAEAFALTPCEAELFKARGNLPWRVVRATLKSPVAFTRRVGCRLFADFIWHKSRVGGVSCRYLLGFPVWSHSRKGRDKS